MTHYRLYFMDPNGRVLRGLDLQCDDDPHAERVVQEAFEGSGLELWSGRRYLLTIPALRSLSPNARRRLAVRQG